MRYTQLVLLLMLPCLLRGQGNIPNTPGYWQDEHNIRLHTTYLLGNMKADGPYGPTRWDSARQHYVSTIPQLLRYPAIAKRGYRMAIVQAAAVEGYPYYTARSAGRNAAQIAYSLDSVMKRVRSRESFTLTYNNDGYLYKVVHWKGDAAARHYERDTTRYVYRQFADGRSRITRTQGSLEYSHTPGYQSVWCGTITRGPLKRIGHNTTIYEMDARGLAASIEFYYVAYANKCPDYTPDHKIQSITYDNKGRAIQIIDSSISYHGRNMLTQVRYDELTPADLADSTWNSRFYHAAHLPLVSRWLATKKSVHFFKETTTQTVFTEYHDKKHIQWITGKPPKVVGTEEVTGYDDKENMLLKVDHYYAPYGVLLYQYGQDSAGTYKGRYGTTSIPAPDTATYWPDQPKLSTEGYYERPNYPESKRGVIQTPYLDYNERNVSPKVGGWQLISYEREMDGYNYNYNMRDEYFWSPAALRWRSTHPPFTHYVVTRPDGLVKYVYDQGTLYKITYME